MASSVTWAHEGDLGTYLEVEFRSADGGAKDISAASVREIRVERPDGTRVAFTAAFTTDGTDGKIRHQWTTNELSQLGRWMVQGFVSGTGFSFSTKRGILTVLDRIEVT